MLRTDIVRLAFVRMVCARWVGNVCTYCVAPTGLSTIDSRSPSPQSMAKFPAAVMVIPNSVALGVVVI